MSLCANFFGNQQELQKIKRSNCQAYSITPNHVGFFWSVDSVDLLSWSKISNVFDRFRCHIVVIVAAGLIYCRVTVSVFYSQIEIWILLNNYEKRNRKISNLRYESGHIHKWSFKIEVFQPGIDLLVRIQRTCAEFRHHVVLDSSCSM